MDILIVLYYIIVTTMISYGILFYLTSKKIPIVEQKKIKTETEFVFACLVLSQVFGYLIVYLITFLISTDFNPYPSMTKNSLLGATFTSFSFLSYVCFSYLVKNKPIFAKKD